MDISNKAVVFPRYHNIVLKFFTKKMHMQWLVKNKLKVQAASKVLKAAYGGPWLSHQIQTLTSNSNSHIKFKLSNQIQILTSNSNPHIKFKLSHQIQTLTSNSNSQTLTSNSNLRMKPRLCMWLSIRSG